MKELICRTLNKKLETWYSGFCERKKYCTEAREPFFAIADPYLPADSDGILLDIGAGMGEFSRHLSLETRYAQVKLLDANPLTIEALRKEQRDAVLYKAPDRLPFGDGEVHFIHCSHLIEHFYHEQLYSFLVEMDRVLKDGGVLVISTPLLWKQFYTNLSHIKPYDPSVIKCYLCRQTGQHTAESISNSYTIQKLVYRYTTKDFGEWGSSNIGLDFLVHTGSKVLKTLGLCKYIPNGYTIVLKKEPHTTHG